MRPKRFAIVIGNSKYSNLATIKGARKDALDICNSLVSLESGWELGPVVGEPVINATRQKMCEAEGWLIAKVDDEIRQGNRNCQTLIYFAGHGKVIDGETYLLPCDYELPDGRGDEDLQPRKMKFPVEAMLKNLNMRKNLLNMMIVDACRTEDCAARDGIDKLMAPNVPGSIVCFGTSSGSKAREDPNGNGWFTGKLLTHITNPGVQIYELLHRTCQSLEDEHGELQQPDCQIRFHGVAYFAEPRASVSVQPLPAASAPSLIAKAAAKSPAAPASPAPLAAAPIAVKLTAQQPAKAPAQLIAKSAAVARAPAVPAAPVGCNADFNQNWEQARRGDAAAQFWIGEQFLNGESEFKKDLSATVSWFRKSAEGGNTEGMYRLGYCYLNGWGVEKDYSAAVSWFQKSAEGGNTSGMYSIGHCYLNGWGVEKEESAAVSWFRKSAEGGNTGGMHWLGRCYRNAWGVEKDQAKTEFWFKKSGW